MLEETMDAAAKKDAVNSIGAFQRGISKNTLRLRSLKPETIAKKKKQSLPKPHVPLYGKGPKEKNSYINLFRIVRLKRGWRVRPRSARHWSGRIKLKVLFGVHEKGATIKSAQGIIKIPARPAWERSQRKFMRSKMREEPALEVKAAIKFWLRTGTMAPVRNFLRKTNKEAKPYEGSD